MVKGEEQDLDPFTLQSRDFERSGDCIRSIPIDTVWSAVRRCGEATNLKSAAPVSSSETCYQDRTIVSSFIQFI